MTAPPSVHDSQFTLTRSRRPGFALGLVVGIVIGFGAGVLVEKKGCPPVPVPAATASEGDAAKEGGR